MVIRIANHVVSTLWPLCRRCCATHGWAVLHSGDVVFLLPEFDCNIVAIGRSCDRSRITGTGRVVGTLYILKNMYNICLHVVSEG